MCVAAIHLSYLCALQENVAFALLRYSCELNIECRIREPAPKTGSVRTQPSHSRAHDMLVYTHSAYTHTLISGHPGFVGISLNHVKLFNLARRAHWQSAFNNHLYYNFKRQRNF